MTTSRRRQRARKGTGSIAPRGRRFFSYVRYDADLTDEGLAARGVTSRRRRARLRKLDAVGAVDDLETVGAGVAEMLNAERDLVGFL